MFGFLKRSEREFKLGRALLVEKSAHEATKRELAIAQAELEAMANVIARDRQRVQAEGAEFTRRRAEAEGSNGQLNESVGRF